MASLFDISNHFDDIELKDAYTSTTFGKGQLSTFMGASPDGSVSQKRVLSVNPTLNMPARKVISALGEVYMTGTEILDGIYGKAIRKSLWTKLVSGSVVVATPNVAILTSGAGTITYSQKVYYKDTVNGVTDASYDTMWSIYFAPSEPVVKGSIILEGSTYFRVRNLHSDPSGFIMASCDELDGPARVALSMNTSASYDPVTDTQGVTTINGFAIWMDRSKWYAQLTEADLKSMPGDMTALVSPATFTPVIGNTCTIAGVLWRILAVTAELDALALHLRRQ